MGAMTAAGAPGFDWHPEPSLVDFHDPSSRDALDRLGEATWRTAIDHLYGEALVHPVGPDSYPQLRERVFGPAGRPAKAPPDPSPSADVLAEIRDRLLPYTYNAHHLRSFSYFTAPPLPVAVAGDVLASWLQQSVDVFHASPIGTLLDEEVTGWLRDLVGYDGGGWGVLTSGGVMANLMAMTVARDSRLARLKGLDQAPRGRDLEDSRVYVSDQAHFSIRRALDVLGFPPETLHVVPVTSSSGCRPSRWRPRSRRIATLGCSRSPSQRWRGPPTPARSTRSRTSRTSPSEKVCGCTWMRRTAVPSGSPVAMPTGCGRWSERTR
jgi:hypothetical protein